MYKIINGKGKGLICKVDFNIKGKKIGNCMCYPINKEYYRICKTINDIERINNE